MYLIKEHVQKFSRNYVCSNGQLVEVCTVSSVMGGPGEVSNACPPNGGRRPATITARGERVKDKKISQFFFSFNALKIKNIGIDKQKPCRCLSGQKWKLSPLFPVFLVSVLYETFPFKLDNNHRRDSL